MSPFTGGIYPKTFRFRTARKNIRKLPDPDFVRIPVEDTQNDHYSIEVQKGDNVITGALIARGTAQAPPIHASITGEITEITKEQSAPGKKLVTITRSKALERTTFAKSAHFSINQIDDEDIKNSIYTAGVIDMEGKDLPPHITIDKARGRKIDHIIVSSLESEPYLTCDTRLISDHPAEVIRGALIIAKYLGAENIHITVDQSWKMTIDILQEKIFDVKHKSPQYKINLVKMRHKYPVADSGPLIESVLGIEKAAHLDPWEVGCFLLNAATSFAVYEAVLLKKPVVDRVVSISGDCVESTENFRVRIGTSVMEMARMLGGITRDPAKLVLGGPLRGRTSDSIDIPVTKSTTGIIFFSNDHVLKEKESACIRCAKCVDVCPMNLLPIEAALALREKTYDAARDYFHIADCSECGACSFICPSRIPLSRTIADGKKHLLK